MENPIIQTCSVLIPEMLINVYTNYRLVLVAHALPHQNDEQNNKQSTVWINITILKIINGFHIDAMMYMLNILYVTLCMM